jgi:polar amino acid transport system substrate-binding protein
MSKAAGARREPSATGAAGSVAARGRYAHEARKAGSSGAGRKDETMMIASFRRTNVFAALVAAALSLASSLAPSAARADAVDDITKAGVIKVGVFGDFPPFSSVSPDMSLKGYDVDVAQILADALKVKPSLVTVTGQNRIPYLTEHRVDILLSVGQSAEREKVIDFTDAYAPYYIAVIGPKALKVEGKGDLAGKSIAVNRGTLEDSSLTEAAPPSADIKRFDNYNSVIQAFLSGQTQLMVVGNDVGADVLARQTNLQPEQKFQLLTSPDHIALNKNEARLKQILNDAVAKMRSDGTLNQISQKWLHKPLDPKDL